MIPAGVWSIQKHTQGVEIFRIEAIYLYKSGDGEVDSIET